MREKETGEPHTIWINQEQKIISFKQVNGYKELSFSTRKEKFDFAIEKGYSGFRIGWFFPNHSQTVVTISKEWMTWGDSYELNISEPEDELVALAVFLTIDCVMEAASVAANN